MTNDKEIISNRPIGNRLPRTIGCFVFIILTISLIVPLLQYHVSYFGHFGVGGLFVNDSLSMESGLRRFADDSSGNFITILGVILLYYPGHYFGALYYLLINTILLALSAFFFLKTISKLELDLSVNKIYLVLLIVVLNFYILAVLFHPNKELPLIFLTNWFVYLLVNRANILLIGLVLLLTFFFRDAHAILLTITYISVRLFRPIFLRRPLSVSFFLVLALSLISLRDIGDIGMLGEYNYIIDRNLAYNEDAQMFLSGLPSYVSFPLKLLNNGLSAALRPQLIDLNDRLYFVGIGLWQFGACIAIGLVSWVYIIIKKNRVNAGFVIVPLSIFFCLFFISFGSYTQPRYMMPYIFWLIAGFVLILDINRIVIFFLGILLVAIVFHFMGFGVESGYGIDSVALIS